MTRDLARELYRAFRSQNRRVRLNEQAEIRERVDDPHALKDILQDLAKSQECRQGIAEGTLFTQWSEIVGEEIGSRTTPISLLDGQLTIQTTSTAWATQLRLISPQLLTTIATSAPGALVEELAIIGPNAPHWKKGVRSIKNARGPRDTYG